MYTFCLKIELENCKRILPFLFMNVLIVYKKNVIAFPRWKLYNLIDNATNRVRKNRFLRKQSDFSYST